MVVADKTEIAQDDKDKKNIEIMKEALKKKYDENLLLEKAAEKMGMEKAKEILRKAKEQLQPQQPKEEINISFNNPEKPTTMNIDLGL